MPMERFKSKEAYRRFNAYRHIHGIPAPHLKTVCIKGKCHTVKHSKLSNRKLGKGKMKARRDVRRKAARKRV
jgi:hypothetical protein